MQFCGKSTNYCCLIGIDLANNSGFMLNRFSKMEIFKIT